MNQKQLSRVILAPVISERARWLLKKALRLCFACCRKRKRIRSAVL